uniref:E3 ubiquitin-protein ligase TRIM39-like n=1 Tax=Astyanax mexicanus TaxID=7994 RepID=A0A3B1JY37_ASTMX
MASSSSLRLFEDQLQCSICLEVFNDPVSTPCGHNFCVVCLRQYWDSSSRCQCPVCKAEFPQRPALSINTFISGLAAHEDKLDALSSCLDCGNLEDYICQKHERPLELFCRDDQVTLCQFCTDADHKTHSTVPIEEESLGKMQKEVQQMIQDKLNKVEEIKLSVILNKKSTEKEKADSVEVFKALVRCIKRSQAELLKVMEEKQKAAERQAEEFIKELEQEITELKRRDTELEQISHTEDHLHLLQIYPSLCRPPHTKNWTDVSVNTPLSVKILRKALSQLQKSIDEEMKDLVEIGNTFSFSLCLSVDVTLDPNTAHSKLILSDDGKQVKHGDKRYNYPYNHKRFDCCVCVLGKEGFSSGRFYYEVQVRGNTEWDLGVTRESSERNGYINLNPDNGYWTVCLRNKTEYEALDCPSVLLSLKQAPQKVGVFVDYEEGLVSFYDVEVRSHIYSFTGQTFTEKLYPFFSPSLNHEDPNRAPLIITS